MVDADNARSNNGISGPRGPAVATFRAQDLSVPKQLVVTTIAGTGTDAGSTGDNAPATLAQLNNPCAVAIDSSGNSYIADSWSGKIRKVTKSTGLITTIAGGGTTYGDGLAAVSTYIVTNGVAVDAEGKVYIAGQNKMYVVAQSTGIITTIAGGGSSTADGVAATLAQLNNAYGVAVDYLSNVYIGERGGNRVRMVTKSTGLITTVAGTGAQGSSGDGGLATAATLNQPYGVAVDASLNVYIADYGNH